MADQERTIPFRDGMALGVGINDLTGAVGTLPAIIFDTSAASAADEGMEGRFDTSLVNSSEQMYSSLGVNVSAEGRYGLFSAEGKFTFAEESRFNSSSTFLVARADIQNAFQRVQNPNPTQDAQDLVRDGKTELFRKRYGDLFIRGVKSGGEYIAVLSITNESQADQRELGIALKASFDGIAAGGSVSTEIQSTVSKLRETSEIRVSTYQRGGSGAQISYTGTVEEVMNRLKTFASAVQENPKAYSVQAASYDTLIFPAEPNWFDIRRQQDVLEDCLKKRLQLNTLRNDIEMVLLHPEYFLVPPASSVLTRWSSEITDTLNRLDQHTSEVVDSISAADFFPLALPDGLALPQRNLHSSAQVEVFNHSDFSTEPWQGIPARSQKLAPGWYDDAKNQLLIGNDQLSSIKVPEGLAVRAYAHAWFQGQFIDFTADVPAVSMDWNDQVSSLVVYRADEPPPVVDHIVALDFLWGRWLVLKPGRYDDLNATSLGAATLSALLIPRGMIVRLWDSPGCTGNTTDFLADTLELPAEWNNRAASLEVIDTRQP
ncbi:hypothetical protein [Kribbella catacumbae]|uniref:hypothetical protein n=1 Tax=Kribbella catacumbae TaxID=460086 RepID=UPI0003A86026|nr:hypothetical protein [Kribbella catacumbae]